MYFLNTLLQTCMFWNTVYVDFCKINIAYPFVFNAFDAHVRMCITSILSC